jgi:hypothetical protein
MSWAEKRNRNELRHLFHEHNAAMLNYLNGERAMDLHWEQALQIQARYAKAIIPWEKHSQQKFSRRQFNDMIAMWESVWGKRDAPETQQLIQWTVDQLKELTEKATRKGALRA